MPKDARVQTIMESLGGLLIALFSIVTVTIIALIVWLGPKARDAGPEVGVYEATGERSSTDPDVVSIFHFWTPSMHTKRDIVGKQDIEQHNINRSEVPHWYWASDIEPGRALEQEVHEFLDLLRLRKPVGINISPVFGVGTSDLKRGYLWELTVSRLNPISRKELLGLYKKHWKRENEIWIQQNTARTTRTR